MTFDIKRRLKLLFRPDAHTAALEREACASSLPRRARCRPRSRLRSRTRASRQLSDASSNSAALLSTIRYGVEVQLCKSGSGPACGRSRGLGLRACNSGKVLVNKAPDGHASSNRADGVMIAFAPVSRGMHFLGVFGSDGFDTGRPSDLGLRTSSTVKGRPQGDEKGSALDRISVPRKRSCWGLKVEPTIGLRDGASARSRPKRARPNPYAFCAVSSARESASIRKRYGRRSNLTLTAST